MEPTGMTPAELLDVVRRRKLSLIIPAALVFLAGPDHSGRPGLSGRRGRGVSLASDL